MRRALVRAVKAGLFPTITFLVFLFVFPDRRELVLHVWLLVLLGVALLAALDAIRAAYPASRSVFDARGADEERPGRFASLTRLEREVAMARTSAYDVHVRLRPTLREIATGLLLARRGIDADREPSRARDVLGDEAWDLVRRDRPPPEDSRGPGLDYGALDRVVSRLEQL